MLLFTEFRCSRKASLWVLLMTVKVSSTNLFQSLGVHGDVTRALIQQFEEMQVPNMVPQQSEDEEPKNSPKEEK